MWSRTDTWTALKQNVFGEGMKIKKRRNTRVYRPRLCRGLLQRRACLQRASEVVQSVWVYQCHAGRQWLMWTMRHLRLKTCCEVDFSGRPRLRAEIASHTVQMLGVDDVAAAAADAKWRHDVTDPPYMRPTILSHMRLVFHALYAARRILAAEARRRVVTRRNDMSAACADDRFHRNRFHLSPIIIRASDILRAGYFADLFLTHCYVSQYNNIRPSGTTKLTNAMVINKAIALFVIVRGPSSCESALKIELIMIDPCNYSTEYDKIDQ